MNRISRLVVAVIVLSCSMKREARRAASRIDGEAAQERPDKVTGRPKILTVDRKS